MRTELIEREEFLASLPTKFHKIDEGEGHCIFVSGEAGIGKTSLVKSFRENNKEHFPYLSGRLRRIIYAAPVGPFV